jgi:prophage antirepressor-like protein
MNELIKVFNFEGKELEVLMYNNEALFNPRDVGRCLEISDVTVRRHMQNMNQKQFIKLTNSDVQDMNFRKLNNAGENFLTESGVYKLIFKSHKESAEKFQDWITDEVLPSIRKHGTYMTDNVLEQAISNPDFLIGLLQNLKEEQQQRKIAEEKAKVLEIEVDHKEDVIVGLCQDISLAEKRQRIKQIINHNSNGRYSDRYNLLYKEFQDKYHIDLKRRMNNLEVKSINENRHHEYIKITSKIKTNKMEYIDKILCMIPELYEISCKIFENDVAELMKE